MNITRIPFRMMIAALTIALMLVAGVGCGTKNAADGDTEDALPEIVQKAVEVSRDLEAAPDDVEAVLERHGLDVERFEAMMYEISSDPQLTKAYTAKLGS